MTTTISIALGEEQYARLRARAEQAGISPEDLVRREVESLLARSDEELVRDVDYILRKNAELYKRLA
jgi:antitoxin FitA